MEGSANPSPAPQVTDALLAALGPKIHRQQRIFPLSYSTPARMEFRHPPGGEWWMDSKADEERICPKARGFSAARAGPVRHKMLWRVTRRAADPHLRAGLPASG
jgi:hypothetical protein